MAWYKTGTINLANGSATVYGNGTLWVDAAILNAGDLLIGPDGKLYEIGSFQSNTQLTLTTGYLGSTANTQAYAIVPIGLLPSALAQQVKTTLSTANTALSQAVRFDAAQNLTAPQQATARANIGALAGADVGLGLLSKSVAGNVDVTLTGVEAAALFYEFTGTLTGNVSVIVPNSVRQFFVRNATSGAYTLTVKTAAGAGVAVMGGTRAHLECDGTKVLFASSQDSAFAVDVNGNVGVGTSAPAAKVHINGGSNGSLLLDNFYSFGTANYALKIDGDPGTPGGYLGQYVVNGGFHLAQGGTYYGGGPWTTDANSTSFAAVSGSAGALYFHAQSGLTASTTFTPVLRMTIDPTGNFLVGYSSAAFHRIGKAVTQGNTVCAVDSTVAGASSLVILGVGGANYNGAAAALWAGYNTSTGRSINAGGTINANGADYAEYMTKRADCGVLDKGQIAGVDADGLLTDVFANAVSFLIKSTDPSLVGGDIWGNEASLGMKRPDEPVFIAPEYAGADHPGQAPVPPVDPTEEEAEQYYQATVDYERAKSNYDQDQAAYAARVSVAKEIFDTATYPTYQKAMATFEAALETARQRVDRMAYCGQVPVNVTGAKPGQYIVPIQDGTGIGGQLVDEDTITFAQYRRAVGVVQNILADGRANVRVKVV